MLLNFDFKIPWTGYLISALSGLSGYKNYCHGQDDIEIANGLKSNIGRFLKKPVKSQSDNIVGWFYSLFAILSLRFVNKD